MSALTWISLVSFLAYCVFACILFGKLDIAKRTIKPKRFEQKYEIENWAILTAVVFVLCVLTTILVMIEYWFLRPTLSYMFYVVFVAITVSAILLKLRKAMAAAEI